MQALQNRTLAALEDNTNTLKSVEPQSSFLLSPSSISPVKLKDDIGITITVDNDMIDILMEMG